MWHIAVIAALLRTVCNEEGIDTRETWRRFVAGLHVTEADS